MIEKYYVGIDPGPTHSAMASFLLEDGKFEVVLRMHHPNEWILSQIKAMYGSPKPNAVIIEGIQMYQGCVGRSTFDTCVWIGRFFQHTLTTNAIQPIIIMRPEINTHFTGSRTAKKGFVMKAMTDKYGGKGTKKNPGPFYGVSGHVWDAVALCVYAFERGL